MPPEPPIPHLHIRRLSRTLLFFWMVTAGCVHTIHVDPLPTAPTAHPIPRSVQLLTGPVLKEGADHMPGINQLKWSQDDVRGALIRYAQRRETFTDVSTNPADLTMIVGMKLSLKSRDRYWYKIQLQVEMKDSARPIKQYAAEHEAEGSSVRWTTASDREPIAAALQHTLDDVFAQIEADRPLYLLNGGRPAK